MISFFVERGASTVSYSSGILVSIAIFSGTNSFSVIKGRLNKDFFIAYIFWTRDFTSKDRNLFGYYSMLYPLVNYCFTY